MALFKNKETDKKRKGENVIGKIIYGFLLFAPLMSILFTSLYTVFNKNAYQSYSGKTEIITNVDIEYKYQSNEVNTVDDLIVGNIYEFTFNDVLPSQVNLFECSYINGYSVAYETSIIQIPNDSTDFIRVSLYPAENDFLIGFYRSNNTRYAYIHYSLPKVIFVYRGNVNSDYISYISNTDYNEIVSVNEERSEVTQLDNAFEYGMYKTEQSNIYNWSKETGTYTVLQNVCNQIGITNTFVPMLMAYWLIISIIYFLFDIALILIWAVHDKIHALKDAI